jgi:outer membrane receptor for ferrienterochelin and colicins
MEKIFFRISLFLLLITSLATAQNKLTVTVKDAKTNSPLIGANVYFPALKIGAATDANGNATLKDIPNGKYKLTVSYIGYETIDKSLVFPLKNKGKTIMLLINPKEIKGKQVVVTSTRTNGVESNTPVKVEVLGLEEVNEEIGIRPGNISKLLGETSGVIVQQTSPVSGTVSFRLQGLPGRFTQLLKDGMPIASTLSNGLTLLQIPPLDLQQVEVVKGPSSIFYGNGAVAGFVNLVTRKPAPNRGLELVLNQTSRKGTDLSSFYSNKFNNLGVTLLASFSRQSGVDVAGNGFTDIPKFTQFNVNPKLFYDIDAHSSLELGVNAFYEDRIGGDISAVENGATSSHSYFERNKSNRFGGLLKYKRDFRNNIELRFNNSISYNHRDNSIPNFLLSGKEAASFSELSLLKRFNNHSVVAGISYSRNSFTETDNSEYSRFYDFNNSTAGVFVQDDWKILESFIVQPGFRADFSEGFVPIYLPHISLMYKFTDNFISRLSYAYGYQIPTLFRTDAENRALVSHYIAFADGIRRETANGVNLDFNYKLVIDEFVMKINQSFYLTKVMNSLESHYFTNTYPPLFFDNSASLLSKGFDTNLYLALDELEFFADYSNTDVTKSASGVTDPLFFTPKNKLNLTLSYEEEGSWRTGAEAFYTGKQYLPTDVYSRSYWLFGIMFEKYFSDFSVILNVENLTNERQSKYEKIVGGSVSDPWFSYIYMPVDGIVGNIAIRLKID